MKYLIFLNKFEINKEKLNSKLKKLSSKIKEEKGRLILENADLSKLISLQEINKIYTIFQDWKELNFKDLKKDSFNAIRSHKTYLIETKFLDKIPLSAKSIYKHVNPYLKHEGLKVEDKPEVILYLEFKKENNKKFYRVCYIPRLLSKQIKSISLDFSNFHIILEEPRLMEELSDFLRLCWIFKTPFYILTKDRIKLEKTLKKAKEITKGIDYTKFNLKFIDKLPKDYPRVGFSKHSDKNENDLISFLKNNNKSIYLIFGNDTYGLSQEVRDNLDYCFRLTPELKKPLRACQALSYIFGIYSGIRL